MTGGSVGRRSPLWWAELRAGRFALGLVALLAAGTAATAAVVPAKVAHSDQWVADDVVGHASVVQRDLRQFENTDAGAGVGADAELVERGAQSLASMPPAVRRVVAATDITVLPPGLLPTGAADPATDELPPFYRPVDVPGYEKKVRFVAGAAPTAAQSRTLPDKWTLPIAVGQDVASRFHLEVGSTITSPQHGGSPTPVEITVTGIFAPGSPDGESDPAWTVADRLFHPERAVICANGSFKCDSLSPSWLVDVMAPSADSIARFSPVTTYWDQRVDPALIRSGDLDALTEGVEDIQQGRVVPSGVNAPVMTGLLDLVTQIKATQWSSHVVAAVVLGGAAAGGLAALVLVLGMAIGRRSRHIALVKARGAAPGRLAARHATQVAGVALLAGLAGAALGGRLAGGSLGSAATWYGAAAVAVAAFAVVARLVWQHTDHVVAQRPGPERGDAAVRKVVRDLGVVLAAAGAVGVYRFGGTGNTVGSIDWLAVAAPALSAFAAGTVAVRLMPALLNPVARLAGRGRGTVGFVGASLAGRRVRAVAAPLVGLVVVVAAGMFAAGYDASVTTKVKADAYRSVGAGARVVAGSQLAADEKDDPTGTALAEGFLAKAAALPGAKHAAGAWLGMATLSTRGGPDERVALVVVDTDSFRAVVADTAATMPGQLPALPGSWPATGPAGGGPTAASSDGAPAVPASALAAPGLACDPAAQTTVAFGAYSIAVRCDGSADIPTAGSEMARYSDDGYLVVARSQLRAALTGSATAIPVERATAANTAWISGEVSAAGVHSLPGITVNYHVDLVQDVRAAKFAAGQVKAARDVFHLVEALCVGYFALCMLLLLAATGGVSRDSALLVQIFGLRPGRSRLIALLVPAPIAAVAVAAGVGMGLGLSPLLGPLTRDSGSGSVLATTSIGLGWAVPAAAVVVLLAAGGIALDLLLRRDGELSTRLRTTDYE